MKKASSYKLLVLLIASLLIFTACSSDTGNNNVPEDTDNTVKASNTFQSFEKALSNSDPEQLDQIFASEEIQFVIDGESETLNSKDFMSTFNNYIQNEDQIIIHNSSNDNDKVLMTGEIYDFIDNSLILNSDFQVLENFNSNQISSEQKSDSLESKINIPDSDSWTQFSIDSEDSEMFFTVSDKMESILINNSNKGELNFEKFSNEIENKLKEINQLSSLESKVEEIDNHTDAKIINLKYELNYPTKKLIIEMKNIDDKMLISSIKITEEEKTSSYQGKMGLTQDNDDFYIISYNSIESDYSEEKAQSVINSFSSDTDDTDDNDETEIDDTDESASTLDLSSGTGSVNYAAGGNDSLAVLFSQDNNGSNHTIGNFKTENVSLNTLAQQEKIYIDNNSSVESLANNNQEFPYGGSGDDYLRELERETFDNHNNASSVGSLSSTSAQKELGTTESFQVLTNFSTENYHSIDAELKKIGQDSMLWIDKSINIPSKNIEKIHSEFEDDIHSTVKNYFGREPSTDDYPILTKNGEKVNILITPLNVGGYFTTADLYNKNQFDHSNERKMLYINHYENQSQYLDYQIGTIAHEFQHMIFYNEIVQNNDNFSYNVWLNEGFSQLAEDLTGYGYQQGVSNNLGSFLNSPSDTSLLLWGNSAADYNISYLFARYIYDRFGANLLTDVHKVSDDYQKALEGATGLSFRQLFEDFALALWLNESGTIYGFDSITFDKPQTKNINAGESWSNENIVGWGIQYTKIENNSNDLKIDVNDAARNGNFWLKLIH
ncbi:MAG: hypothetical protein ACOC1O_04335 [bacterium]